MLVVPTNISPQVWENLTKLGMSIHLHWYVPHLFFSIVAMNC